MATTMKIDFRDLGMPVFTGRPRGEQARKRLRLDGVAAGDAVDVIIPNDVYALTSSYFLGLFGPSVRKFGLEEFQRVFRFEAPEFLKDQLSDWTLRALRDGGDLLADRPTQS